MQKFTAGVLINRSQQTIFDFLSDFANLPKSDSDFESAEWTFSGVPNTGSMYRASGRKLGSEKDGFFEIIQWDHPNRYSYKVTEQETVFINLLK